MCGNMWEYEDGERYALQNRTKTREREREREREILHHSQSLAFNHLFEEKKRLDNIVDIFAVWVGNNIGLAFKVHLLNRKYNDAKYICCNF